MNIKRIVMMLSVMLITILSASSFYVLTGESQLNKNIIVNSSKTEDGDYEKVYGEGPYTETNNAHKDEKYYIRYTGKVSGRTVVDLDDTDVKDTNGNSLNKGGCGLTREKDGTIKIFNQEIKSTYKMFSYRSGENVTNTKVTRIFIPAIIAIKNNGIAENTFEGTTQEIDCIYHTGDTPDKNLGASLTLNGTYDKTHIFDESNKNNNTNIVSYVYLGTENFFRQIYDDITTNPVTLGQNQYSYYGTIQNVFVGSEIDDIRFLFSRDGYYEPEKFGNQKCTLMHKVLLDDNGSWSELTWLFVRQSELDLSEKFYIPHSDLVQNMPGMFAHCISLTHLPEAFTMPKNAVNLCTAFYCCPNLSALIEVGDKVEEFTNCFYGTGGSASNYKYCNTPIIVKYPVTNSILDNYTVNVWTSQTPDGEVTMIPLTGSTSNWKKYYETGAPYYDENGAYYVRYEGSNKTVDIGAETNDIKISAGTKHSCVADTKLLSTYKMFSKRNESNAVNTEVTRIYIPSNIAINGDKSTAIEQSDGTYKFDENKGITSNTFAGYESSTVEKDVIYHTENILLTDDITSDGITLDKETANAKGMGITAIYDRTTKISKTTFPNITTYLYLGNNNVLRGAYVNPTLPAIYYDYQYNGSVTNVFVSNEVDYPVGLFCHTTATTKIGTLIDYALLDTGETWFKENMGLAAMFFNQSNLQITSNFKLPDKIYQGDNTTTVNDAGLVGMFKWCISLSDLQKEFIIPEGVTNLNGLFMGIPNLRGVIRIPLTAEHFVYVSDDTSEFITGSGTTSKYLDGKNGSIVLEIYKNSSADKYFSSNKYPNIVIEYLNNLTSQSFADTTKTITTVQESTNAIMIKDCTEEVYVRVNAVENNAEKIVIEDTTEYVNVIVNEKNEDKVEELVD